MRFVDVDNAVSLYKFAERISAHLLMAATKAVIFRHFRSVCACVGGVPTYPRAICVCVCLCPVTGVQE
jgi:hypothetical protein